MKNSILFLSIFTSFSLAAQKPITIQTGLPGDNFSLEGALDLFKKANSLEEFEKLLNSEENNVNNLDLNENGETDYIRVVDHVQDDAHAIVLQALVSESESQDIAVIEVEKTGKDEAVVQIIGDEDIFGKQIIIESYDDKSNNNSVAVNVWFWPSVRFIYHPAYVVWASPWSFRTLPVWWRPWRPYPWNAFHAKVLPFRNHYHVVTVHRVTRAHQVYVPKRTHSSVVHTKTTTTVRGRTEGGRKVEMSKTRTNTEVRGKRGNSVGHEKTTKKAEVKGKKGGAEVKKTTSKTSVKKRGG